MLVLTLQLYNKPIKQIKVMNINSISFSELQKFNDSNSVVMIATEFPEGFDFSEVDEFLSEQLGFSKGKNLIGVHFIEGNVRGSDGRKDWLLEFDHEEVQFNPIARLRFPDLKWTSDFMDIFCDDYYYEAVDEPYYPEDMASGNDEYEGPMNSSNSFVPSGQKFKATISKDGKEDFVMLYAESDVDAYQRCIDVFEGTGYEIIKIEEA